MRAKRYAYCDDRHRMTTVEVLTSLERRRRWSREEKLRIVAAEADQDRRQGGEPRPLHRVPDGQGRHPTADVPGDFATYRGTAAAAAVGTGMRHPIFMHQRQPTGGVRPNATQNGQTDPRTPCRSLLC